MAEEDEYLDSDPRHFNPETYTEKPGKSKRFENDKAEGQEEPEKIGKHQVSQAKKLLAQPILIPRDPAALAVQIIALVFLLDFTSAMIFLLFAFIFSEAAAGIMVAGGIVLFTKSVVLIGIIAQTTYKWIAKNYFLDERQLIIKVGIVNKNDKSFELANIRHVIVKQDVMGKRFNYGRIELVIATAGLNEDITLKDVKNPKHFENVFRNYLG